MAGALEGYGQAGLPCRRLLSQLGDIFECLGFEVGIGGGVVSDSNRRDDLAECLEAVDGHGNDHGHGGSTHLVFHQVMPVFLTHFTQSGTLVD